MREIADEAGGISSSLVSHHFGSKAQLFEAALVQLFESSPVFSFDRINFGETFVSYVVERLEGPTIGAMIALSTGDEEARAITARFSEEYSLAKLAEWLGGENARARAYSIMSLSIGLGLFGRELPLNQPPEGALEWAATTIQRLVDNQ